MCPISSLVIPGITRLEMSRYMLANIVLAVVSKQTNKTYPAHVAPFVIQKCIKTGSFHDGLEKRKEEVLSKILVTNVRSHLLNESLVCTEKD